jgi:hypothetical protein
MIGSIVCTQAFGLLFGRQKLSVEGAIVGMIAGAAISSTRSDFLGIFCCRVFCGVTLWILDLSSAPENQQSDNFWQFRTFGWSLSFKLIRQLGNGSNILKNLLRQWMDNYLFGSGHHRYANNAVSGRILFLNHWCSVCWRINFGCNCTDLKRVIQWL